MAQRDTCYAHILRQMTQEGLLKEAQQSLGTTSVEKIAG